MVHFTTLPLFLCTVGLISETLCSLTLEAEAGDNVTIWCQHGLTNADKIFWFKQTCGSVPLLLGCKQFRTSAPSPTCYFFTESERIVMSVHGKNTSLTITAVNVSDTGLYYCSFSDQMIFRNSTSLQVKVSVSSGVFFILSMILAPLIMILLGVLIFNILKHRKMHRGDKTDRQDDEEQESDSVNYAALHFSNKKTKRPGRRSQMEDPHVIYSGIKQ
uniref:Novel immune-type receptor 12a n=1 Tax=Ictalurus punctatus TaxID=7998 RepID=A4UU48_ICTPU|nr:novel immune-type receptor 12a precursor [Ictalurus punctatus]ABP02017.1 novel immune-type receptor 12a [Ictalurus punctatus]